MLASGAVSVRTVSEVLGHSSTSITADTYGHVMDSAKAHALGVVDDVLWVNRRPNCRPKTGEAPSQ
jgi:integrase